MKKDASKMESSNNSDPQKLPETPSGLLASLIGNLPRPLRTIVIILLLGVAAFVAYHYFTQPNLKKNIADAAPEISTKRVFVSGQIYMNNREPKPNEVKRITLRNIDSNPAHLDAAGRFTFENIRIPANRRLLVDITFNDGQTLPTEELIVGDADNETNTVRLPDLFAERPKPATKTNPAKSWTISPVYPNDTEGSPKVTGPRNHFESKDQSKQNNFPDNQGTINLNQ